MVAECFVLIRVQGNSNLCLAGCVRWSPEQELNMEMNGAVRSGTLFCALGAFLKSRLPTRPRSFFFFSLLLHRSTVTVFQLIIRVNPQYTVSNHFARSDKNYYVLHSAFVLAMVLSFSLPLFSSSFSMDEQQY